ncbi:MAG: DMT family transporter [Ferruginibacter sp.]|nr:DMT family transporter [Cytophagales bacterium]
MPASSATLKDYLHLHFIVVLWGFTAILGKYITIPAVELVFFRTLLAFGGLGAMLYARRPGRVSRDAPPTLPLREAGPLLATGTLIAAHWILFFAAARVANVSVCLAGMATSSLWTSILEPLVNGRRIRPLEIGIGLVVMAGLYLVFHFEFNHALGGAMAVGSAMLAAMFSVLNGGFSRRHDAFVITFYEMGGAFAATALFLPFYAAWLVPDGTLRLMPTILDWLLIAGLAFACTVYAYSAAVQLLRRFSVFAMNLIINLEPVYGIGLAFLILGESERMTTGFYLGTLVILVAVLSYPVLDRLTARTVVK